MPKRNLAEKLKRKKLKLLLEKERELYEKTKTENELPEIATDIAYLKDIYENNNNFVENINQFNLLTNESKLTIRNKNEAIQSDEFDPIKLRNSKVLNIQGNEEKKTTGDFLKIEKKIKNLNVSKGLDSLLKKLLLTEIEDTKEQDTKKNKKISNYDNRANSKLNRQILPKGNLFT